MKGGGGHGRLRSDAARILLVVLFGSLAISAHSARELGAAGGGSSSEMVAAAGDEEGRYGGCKIYLIFCQKSPCEDNLTCYCCLIWKSACWLTMENCRRSCPVCDPKCHPPLPRGYRRRRPRSLAPPVDDEHDDSKVSSLAR